MEKNSKGKPTTHPLFEGFWDGLLNKAKNGALAAGTALGSSSAQGKLSASLLGTELYRQYKSWVGKTGQDDIKSFAQYMNNLGFSQGFAKQKTQDFDKFLQSSDSTDQNQDDKNKFEIGKDENDQAQSGNDKPNTQQASGDNNNQAADNVAKQPEQAKQAEEPAKAAEPAQAAEPAKPANAPTPGDKQRAMRAQQRAGMKRESVEYLKEASDSQLRDFFNQMAKDAFANGEARSAAKHELKTALVTPTNYKPQDGGQAPAGQPQGQKSAQAPAQQPAAEAPPEAPQQAPQAAPAAQPAQAQQEQPSVVNVDYTPEEEQILNMIPGTGLERQITAQDPGVQELARKIMKSAIIDYQKKNPPKAPAKKKAQPQAPAAQPASAEPAAPPSETPPAQ